MSLLVAMLVTAAALAYAWWGEELRVDDYNMTNRQMLRVALAFVAIVAAWAAWLLS